MWPGMTRLVPSAGPQPRTARLNKLCPDSIFTSTFWGADRENRPKPVIGEKMLIWNTRQQIQKSLSLLSQKRFLTDKILTFQRTPACLSVHFNKFRRRFYFLWPKLIMNPALLNPVCDSFSWAKALQHCLCFQAGLILGCDPLSLIKDLLNLHSDTSWWLWTSFQPWPAFPRLVLHRPVWCICVTW